MDQVTKVRRHIKREQLKTLIKDCQSSGMTVTDWCKTNGICEQTYYRNLKTLREELCENLPVLMNVSEKPATFKKLEGLHQHQIRKRQSSFVCQMQP